MSRLKQLTWNTLILLSTNGSSQTDSYWLFCKITSQTIEFETRVQDVVFLFVSQSLPWRHSTTWAMRSMQGFHVFHQSLQLFVGHYIWMLRQDRVIAITRVNAVCSAFVFQYQSIEMCSLSSCSWNHDLCFEHCSVNRKTDVVMFSMKLHVRFVDRLKEYRFLVSVTVEENDNCVNTLELV